MNKLSVIRIVAFSNKNYAIHIPLSSWGLCLNGKILELKGAGSKVRYDLSSDLMCIHVTGRVQETAVGKTVKRMAVTGIASSLLSQGKGMGGAMMDLAVRGAETRIIISARMAMKDTTTIDLEATEDEYRQFVSGLPACATTSQARSRAEDMISLVERMSLDGPRALPEIDGRAEALIKQKQLAEKQIIDGGSFGERDAARLEAENLGNEIEYLQQLKKAVMYRLSAPPALTRKAGFLKKYAVTGLALAGAMVVLGAVFGGNPDGQESGGDAPEKTESAVSAGNAQAASPKAHAVAKVEAPPPKIEQVFPAKIADNDVAAIPVAGPSFDCSKSTSDAERMICSSPELSAADARLAELYGTVLAASKNQAELQADQLNWIRTQRNVCADVPCMRDVYEARRRQLIRMQMN